MKGSDRMLLLLNSTVLVEWDCLVLYEAAMVGSLG